MRKDFKFALLAATAALSLGFASCASDDVAVEDNPNYNPVTNEVKANFVFSVSTGNSATTRMTNANTQGTASTHFRGIDHGTLLSFKLVSDGAHVTNAQTADKGFSFGTVMSADQIEQSDVKNTSNRVLELSLPTGTNTVMFYGKAIKDGKDAQQGAITFNVDEDLSKTKFSMKKRVVNETLLSESEEMLLIILNRIVQNGLYKESSGSGRDLGYKIWWPKEPVYKDGDTEKHLKDQGSVLSDVVSFITNSTNTTETQAKTFTLSDGSTTKSYSYQRNTGGKWGQQGTLTIDDVVYTYYVGEVEWKEYGDKYANRSNASAPVTRPTKSTQYFAAEDNLSPLGEILGDAFKLFTTINDDLGEIRAGSAPAITYMVQDLWSITNKVKKATPTNVQETVAKLMAERISTRFDTYFTGNEAADGTMSNVELKPVSELISAVRTYVDSSKQFSELASTTIDNFPGTDGINLPMGGAQLSYAKETNTFSYVTELPTYGMGGGANGTTNVRNYVYPAELTYFGNSEIRVSDKEYSASTYPNGVGSAGGEGVKPWDAETSWDADWKQNDKTYGHVVSTTRSVAMKKDVNYGTSLLKLEVKYDSGGTLEDNNANIHSGESPNTITTSNNPFELTGVVIGGQCIDYGWDFTQYPYTKDSDKKENAFKYMIYDSEIANHTIPTPANGENYTLVFDNFNRTNYDDGGIGKKDQDPVYVALEFKNVSGKGFWGKANYIRNNGTFYIIGKLDPAASGLASSLTWDVFNNLPPYGTDGSTIKEPRVFIQDHMTSATFVIGKESLKSAYVTVPDLRATQISFGLSVNLKWETGLNFQNINLGGTE